MSRKLTEQQKRANKIARALDTARQYQISTYLSQTASPLFQRMVRTEAAAKDSGYEIVVEMGRLAEVWRQVGQVACVTCGKVRAYNQNQMDAGHYLSRCRACVILDPINCHPQCKSCNRPPHNGRPAEYRAWMIYRYGAESVEALERRNRQEIKKFTHQELAEKVVEYRERIRAAELAIDAKLASGGGPGAYVLPYVKP